MDFLVQWSEKVAPGPWLRSVGISEFFFVRALQENYLCHLFHLCRIVPIKIEFVGILLRGSPIPIYENLILASFEQQRFLFLLLVEQQLPVKGRHWGVRHWGEGGLHNAPHLRRLCSRLAWDVMQVMNDDSTLGGGAGVLIVVRDMDDMVDMDERPPGEVRPPIREEGELRPPSIWSKMKVNPKFGLSQIFRLYWLKNWQSEPAPWRGPPPRWPPPAWPRYNREPSKGCSV